MLKSVFSILSSQETGLSSVSLKMIFGALQFELFRFKIHSLGSKILKFPEFNLSMGISLTFATSFSNFQLYSIDSTKSLPADCWSPIHGFSPNIDYMIKSIWYGPYRYISSISSQWCTHHYPSQKKIQWFQLDFEKVHFRTFLCEELDIFFMPLKIKYSKKEFFYPRLWKIWRVVNPQLVKKRNTYRVFTLLINTSNASRGKSGWKIEI